MFAHSNNHHYHTYNIRVKYVLLKVSTSTLYNDHIDGVGKYRLFYFVSV